MEDKNILKGDINSLREFRDIVDRNVNARNQVELTLIEEKRLEKELSLNKKNLKDDIDSTIKSRRNQVASQFDSEMSKEEDKLRKAKGKRDRAKEKGVKERISDETADLARQNKEIKGNIRTELKGARLPKFCGSAFYFTLYFTKGFGEVMTCALMVILMFLLLPGGIYALLPINFEKKFWPIALLAITYFVVIVFCCFIYIIIGKKTKGKQEEKLKEIRQLRDRVNGNKKQIKKITKSIRKDKNEEMYGLGDFDEKIRAIESEIQRINGEKEAAILNFDENVKSTIVKEIEAKELPRIEELEAKYNEAVTNREAMEEIVKQTGLKISSEYEAYLGKEYTNLNKIDRLMSVMESGKATTISEAIEVVKTEP